MKKILLAFLLIMAIPVHAFEINPAKSVLGVPWNSSEQATEIILGKPNGFFQVTKYKKYVFYGNSIALIFERDKLKGLIYSEYLLVPLYKDAISVNEQFSNPIIKINGVTLSGASFSELASSLPYKFGSPTYQVKVATDEAQIQFNFSSVSKNGSETGFRFSGLEIHYEL